MSNSSSFNSSLQPLTDFCFSSEVTLALFSAMTVTNLLLLPIFILVLYLGYQQWRQQPSGSAAATGPSNLFTYHAIALQLNIFLGLILMFYGSHNHVWSITSVGICFIFVTSAGQSLFHILICVEHYLAVIHPVTYLHLKRAGEARIRHVCAGCVWLLSFGWLLLNVSDDPVFNFIFYCATIAVCLTVICFCSISVLYALRRPGPGQGEGGGTRAQADQSKQRAFYTILIILGVLLFGFVGNVIVNILPMSSFNNCALLVCSMWLNLPSNLVLPMLFLHRAGKLRHCQQKMSRITSCLDEAGAGV